MGIYVGTSKQKIVSSSTGNTRRLKIIISSPKPGVSLYTSNGLRLKDINGNYILARKG